VPTPAVDARIADALVLVKARTALPEELVVAFTACPEFKIADALSA
jgi:hypothetical protein